MRLLLLPLVLSLSACSLIPELVKPASPVPAQFPGEGLASTQVHVADLDWHSMFVDKRLQHLIGLALENNRDLRLAALNVEVLRAQYGIQNTSRLPAIDAKGTAVRQRTAANAEPSQATAGGVQEQYGVSMGLSAFEVDLFGRVHAHSDAAFARYLASDHGRRATQISLIGAVADAYFSERLAQEQQELAERTLADWSWSLELVRMLKEAKQNSGLDVAQAEGQVESAKADVEARVRMVKQARNALHVLVGTEIPEGLPAPLPLSDQAVMTQLPAGLPSDLLLRRPDVLQAEQNLTAANADIGAARAAFFPRLSLTTSVGYASPSMSSLFDAGSRVWTFAPQLTLPIFQAGKLRAELRLAEVRKSSAVAEYEKTIQTAFREVADTLAGQETYGRQVEAQTRVVILAQRRTELSALRYRAGLEGRLELLDSQRQLYAARQSLLDLLRSAFANAIALYKALGGGLVGKASEVSHAQ